MPAAAMAAAVDDHWPPLSSSGVPLEAVVASKAQSTQRAAALVLPLLAYKAAATLQGVHFLDIHDAICDVRSGLCGPVLPGWSAASHRDDHHLSHEGSFSLWPRFRELFQDAGLM